MDILRLALQPLSLSHRLKFPSVFYRSSPSSRTLSTKYLVMEETLSALPTLYHSLSFKTQNSPNSLWGKLTLYLVFLWLFSCISQTWLSAPVSFYLAVEVYLFTLNINYFRLNLPYYYLFSICPIFLYTLPLAVLFFLVQRYLNGGDFAPQGTYGNI